MEELLPKSEGEFAEVEYWDKFYRLRGSTPFEWYVDATTFAKIVLDACDKEGLIVNLGCGTCRWPAEFAGFARVWSVDNSQEAVSRCENTPTLTYVVDDALRLESVDSGSADLVVDKGLVDAVHPRDDDEARESMKRLMATVTRVLRVGASFLFVSLLQEHVRSLLQRSSGQVSAIDVKPLDEDENNSALLPFIVSLVPTPGTTTRLSYCGEVAGNWKELWEKVQRAAADHALRHQSKHQLAAVTIRIGLRGRHASNKNAVEELRAKVQEVSLPLSFIKWSAPPRLFPLAFGLSDVRATALIDAAVSSPDQFADALAESLGCIPGREDGDASSSSSDEDEGEASFDRSEVRISLPEVIETSFGFAR